MPLSASLSFANEQAMDLHTSVNLKTFGSDCTNSHVLLGAVSDPLGPPNCSEKRHPDIARVAVAPEGNGRYAHPECLARSSGASVRKHVKGDVQLAVCGQVRAVIRNSAGHNDAAGKNTEGLEKTDGALLDFP